MWCVMGSKTPRIHQIEKVLWRYISSHEATLQSGSSAPANPKRTIHTYLIILRCYIITQVTYVVFFLNFIKKFGS